MAYLKKDKHVFDLCASHRLHLEPFLQDTHYEQLNNESLNVILLHHFKLPFVLLNEIGPKLILGRLLAPQDLSHLLGRDLGLHFHATLHHVDHDAGLSLTVNLHYAKVLSAIIAHLVTPGLIKIFSQEVELHLPATQIGLLAVV